MKSFFPMPAGDLLYIAVLLAFSVVAFLPAMRAVEWAGMSLLGWMMALLMVLSPTVALVRLLLAKRLAAQTEDAG